MTATVRRTTRGSPRGDGGRRGNSSVARRRLRNSGLTGTRLRSAEEVVRRHGAMQSQDYAPAKWSIAQRTPDLVDEEVEAAVNSGAILRTHVLRPTWHFVARDDIRWLLALTSPRVQKDNAARYRELGLDSGTLDRCQAVIASALHGGNHLTRNEIAAVLQDEGVGTSGQRLPHILGFCELEAAICSGRLAGRQHTYALLDERAPRGRRFDRDEALAELTRRYLGSHGPATVHDLRWWSSLTVADVKRGLHLLGSEVTSEVVDGVTLWSMASESRRAPRGGGVHLLQPYDEVIVGYTASRYFGDTRAEAARGAWKDRSLPNGVAVLDGAVFGHWRRTLGKDSVTVELLTYEDPTPAAARALDAGVTRLGRFLGREALLDVKRLPRAGT